jgi:hypothetical protein
MTFKVVDELKRELSAVQVLYPISLYGQNNHIKKQLIES